MAKHRRIRKPHKKSLHQQKYDELHKKFVPGTSKHAAKKTNTHLDFIYSYETLKTYSRQGEHYVKFIRNHHPEVTDLSDCRPYVPEYLNTLIERNLSPYSVHTAAKAIGKLLDIHYGDPDYYTPPPRYRADIKRGRPGNSAHAHFSEKNNIKLIHFGKGTGLRRSEAVLTYPEHLYTRDHVFAEVARIEAIPANLRTRGEEDYLTALLAIQFFPNEQYRNQALLSP